MATLDDLLAANGQPDEQEPWCAADPCECIEIRGEDLVVLCEDGVARWTNNQREWSVLDGGHLCRVAEEIYESGMGGNADEARKFLDWMGRFGHAPEVIRRLREELDAESVDR